MKYQEDFVSQTVDFYKDVIHQLRNFKLTQNKMGISHGQVIPFATYCPWIDDEDFQGFYTIIKENTLVDIYRCYELWKLVLNAEKIEGDILEVGVWRGGTAALIAGAMLENSKAAKQQSSKANYILPILLKVLSKRAIKTLYIKVANIQILQKQLLFNY